jgi:hypothetical protein
MKSISKQKEILETEKLLSQFRSKLDSLPMEETQALMSGRFMFREEWNKRKKEFDKQSKRLKQEISELEKHLGRIRLNSGKETVKVKNANLIEVTLQEAKEHCRDKAKEQGVLPIEICRPYLLTHKIKGKQGYKAEKLSGLIASEKYQGRS